MAQDNHLVMFAWQDLIGITRVRSVPSAVLADRMEYGLGWAVAGHAIHPFSDIVDNPWGSMVEVRQVPDPATEVFVDHGSDTPPLHFFICDALNPDGSPWDCCPRAFLKSALDDFTAQTGLRFLSAFEHEFSLTEITPRPGPSFAMESMRLAAPFTAMAIESLRQAGVDLEAIEPEYGVSQYEVSTAPRFGVAGADQALVTREVLRDTARQLGLRASFTPKPDPDAVGNGVHMHFSFVDEAGDPAAFDPSRPGEVAEVAGQFVAGVLRHLPALTALTAPGPISYYRLRPHSWSCAYTAFGVQNREAAIRVCPSPQRDPAKRGAAFNLEFRAADGLANLYLLTGAIVRAGLEGIRRRLPQPPFVEGEPDDLSAGEREKLGLRRLPDSLDAALAAFAADDTVQSWFSDDFRTVYSNLKRFEAEHAAKTDPADLCAQYRLVY